MDFVHVLIHEVRRRSNKYFIPCLALVLTIYFIYSLIQGGRGLIALNNLEKTVHERERRFAALQVQHDRMAHTVNLLHPNSLCPDLLEERAKAVIGYAHENEQIYLVK